MLITARNGHRDITHRLIIDRNLSRRSDSSRQTDRNPGCAILSAGNNDIGFRSAIVDGIVLKEVATALKPSILIHLMERMIIVGSRIKRTYECGTIGRFGLRIALRDEITAIIAVGIAGTDGCRVTAPADRTLGVEQPATTGRADWDLFQVISFHEVRLRERFVLQIATVAVHTDF